jgi:hypothetical protein
LEEVQHVLGGLTEVSFTVECWKGCLLRKEIDFEHVNFFVRVRHVASPATVVFQGRSNIPAKATVRAE